MATIFLLLMSVACVSSLLQFEIDREWGYFLVKYNKTYESSGEHKQRLQIFTENLEKMKSHNMAADKGKHSYWIGINHMADWTDEEYEEKLLGLDFKDHVMTKGENHESAWNLSSLSLPQEIDWRIKNCVTPVKYQRSCGSCYAFASTGALESHQCLKTGRLVSLSEQNIIDCTNNIKYHNKGCTGGLMDRAYKYILENGGIDTEESYPYTASVGDCQFNPETVGATIVGYKDVLPRGDEFQLKAAVATTGPVSVGVDASKTGFKLYSYGVYDSSDCSSTKIDHAVLVIGYGEKDGQEYWLIKNSWSSMWGIDGYMKMIRNRGNRCGIATLASYPVL